MIKYNIISLLNVWSGFLQPHEWILKQQQDEITGVLQHDGYSRVLSCLLANRELENKAKVQSFLSFSLDTLHNPFSMKNMQKSVDRIKTAIANGEKITIYGDYDVDGVTATALLYLFLKSQGADVHCYIPQRENEGYGLNQNAVQQIAQDGTTLIITVDTGISAISEAMLAQELGVCLIITDHHQPRDILPEAFAIINPNQSDCDYPFKQLSGVGVAFKLACAISDDSQQALLEKYGDLVCLGTVADVVPLVDENRYIVKTGLQLISEQKREGIKALLQEAAVGGKILSAMTLAFTLAPRINACGRMSSAMEALDLLICDDPIQAQKFAFRLGENNKQRQSIESNIVNEAINIINKDTSITDAPVLIVCGEGWHNGVVGIVAARIMELYAKPCILISFDGDEGRSSCRSLPGFNIFKALKFCEHLLVKYGGHELAAGFSISRNNLDEFTKNIQSYVLTLPPIPPIKLSLDCELLSEELTLNTASEISQLEPYGSGNPTPLFLITAVQVTSLTQLSNGKHLRLNLLKDGNKLVALLFNIHKYDLELETNELYDLAVNIDVNIYNGNKSLSVYIKDYRKSKVFEQQENLYRLLKDGTLKSLISNEFVPVREDFAVVFKYIQSNTGNISPKKSLLVISKTYERMNLFKFRVILDVFEETGLIKTQNNGDNYNIEINVGIKIDLNKSMILKRISNNLQL
jgi:single-stranded-DNA-specific exonuclease